MRGPRSFIDRLRNRAALREAHRRAAALPPDVSLSLVIGGSVIPVKGTLDVGGIAQAFAPEGGAPDGDAVR